MGLVTDYLKYQEEYQERYGERTVVLYQNGSFYEIFEFDPDKDETGEMPAWPTQKLGHAVYLSSLLGYTLTKRDKSKPYSLKNPNMVGFPIISYDKYKDLILSKDFTIIVVDQERTGKNAPRSVSQVVSPATEISDLNPIPVTNQIVSVYLDIQKEAPKFEDYLIAIGISTIDVTTGNNIVGEVYSKKQDEVHALQEVYRFLLSTQPRELIVNINGLKAVKTDTAKKEKYKSYVTSVLELTKYPMVTIIVNKIDPEYIKPNYQQQFLSKIFSPPSNPIVLSSKNNNNTKLNLVTTNKEIVIAQTNDIIVEELGLERMHHGTVSYVLLLQYCYEHNERLIERIQKPDTRWIDESEHLVIAHNALKQLDVVPPIGTKRKKGKIDSLLSVIDNTSTSLGRRYLEQQIANPITDSAKLEQSYCMIDDLIGNEKLLDEIETTLKKIPDLERYQRKLQLRLIKPNEFVTLFRAYVNIVKLYTDILNSKTSLHSLLFSQVNEFNECLTVVLSLYNLDNLNSAIIENEQLNAPNKIFYPGRDTTADQIYNSIKEYKNRIDGIVSHLNSHLSGTRGKLIEYSLKKKTKKNDPSRGLAFFTTTHKGNVLKKAQIDAGLCGDITITTVNKEAMITSEVISTVCENYSRAQDQYGQYLYRCYNKTVSDISKKYDFFSDINAFISKLDYAKSNARTAIKNNYLRPTIDTENSDVSYMDIQELRHPVSECLIDTKYVTNDLVLGKKPCGMLLYGANSVGKSTLTKAVGLNLIMAQAGMYTACKLKYIPYTKIITRLSGEDDLIQGKSSFVVAMTELRTIHRNADARSLVLGDELCRETESLSGSAIAVKSLMVLTERKTSFIFSTHMHHLVTNPYVMKLPENSLRICHLVLKYDEATKSLVYDRKLQEGSGESIYGLEVAMSLSFDPEFIRGAAEIRRQIMGQGDQFLSTKKSKYNNKVYMDSCTLCGKKSDILGKGLHSHHIEEQSKANEKGFIDHYHKDSSFNIITLCESCHQGLHSNGLKIITQQTPSGKIVKIPI